MQITRKIVSNEESDSDGGGWTLVGYEQKGNKGGSSETSRCWFTENTNKRGQRWWFGVVASKSGLWYEGGHRSGGLR